jgi:pimeloyl-ACP methyl ester carboxylesterase
MTDVAGMAEVSWRSWLRRFWLRLWLGNGPAGKGLIDEMKKLWATQPKFEAEQLRGIIHPVLSVVGSNDCITIAHNQSLTDLLPDATPITDDVARYSAPITHAAEINRPITTFLTLSSEHRSE